MNSKRTALLAVIITGIAATLLSAFHLSQRNCPVTVVLIGKNGPGFRVRDPDPLMVIDGKSLHEWEITAQIISLSRSSPAIV